MFDRITYHSNAKLERIKLISQSYKRNAYTHMSSGTSIEVYLVYHAFTSIFYSARHHFTGLTVFEISDKN